MTTAAGLWVAAAVGLLVGAGFYAIAFAAVISTVITLAFLKPFEEDLRNIGNPDRSPVQTRSRLIRRLRRPTRKPTGLQ